MTARLWQNVLCTLVLAQSGTKLVLVFWFNYLGIDLVYLAVGESGLFGCICS
jgi:hypothetical protein